MKETKKHLITVPICRDWKITRRDFLKGTSYAALGTVVGFSAREAQTKKSQVILIRHSEAVDSDSRIDGEIIQQMLDKAVLALMGGDSPVKAFSKLVKPDEIVGIKSNVWSYLPTPPELEKSIKRRLLDVGVKEENISIDDHGVKQNPVFQKSTSLINVRPLRTHYLAGISGCIKNYIMFADSQPAYHPNSCSELGALFKLPMVKGKTRLNILAALTPQFHGRGPHHFSRRYIWRYNGLIVGRDPVAVDAIGLQLIIAKRTQILGKAKSIPPVPRHIRIADTKHGIGTSDLSKIDLIKIGWKDDILI
jgi:hypothetical protein